MLCSLEGCTEKYYCRGYCQFHYGRWYHKKPLDAPISFRAAGTDCVVVECGKKAHARGYCKKHYSRWIRHGDPIGIVATRPGFGWIDKGGYRYVTIDGKSIQEHRYIMETYLGRVLEKEEIVHHKNGIRTDNRLANLELWCIRHPKGSRVEDLLIYAREILGQYSVEFEQKLAVAV